MPFHNAVAEFLFGGSVDNGDKSRGRIADIQEQQLEQARVQQAEWERVYGPIQDKIANSLRNLSIASVSAAGLQGVEQEFEAAGFKVRENIAQRGLESSGLQTALDSRLDIKKAEAKASIRADAPDKVLNQQSKFLSLGLAQKDRQSLESQLQGQQIGTLANDAARQDQLAAQDTGNLGTLLDLGIRGTAAFSTGGASEVVRAGTSKGSN